MRRVVAGIILAILAILAAAPASAQRPASAAPLPTSSAPHYVPSTKVPEGTELVAVFISSSWCVANRDSAFKPTVRRMMTRLAEDARAAGRPLDIIGVSLDWSVADGVRYLQEFGDFDEINVGRNWFNLAAMEYIWRDPDGLPAVPQVVLLERTVGQSADGKRVQVGPDRVLGRYGSVGEIRRVAEQGSSQPPGPGPAPPSETPPGSRVATVTAGVGNPMGWLGAQGEVYVWADRVTTFMGLGYTMRRSSGWPGGVTGALGARAYTAGWRHRGFVELSLSQVAVERYPWPERRYGPGLQVGYQFVSRRGLTLLASAGAGYARGRRPAVAYTPVVPLLGLGVGYTWRR